MRKLFSLLFFVVFPLLPSFVCAEASLIQQAEAAWAKRDQAGQTLRAITLWEQALRENPAQRSLLIPLTSACGRAYRHAKSRSERIHWADKTRRFGEEAVAKNPENAWAWTVDGEALGQWAEAHKGIQSLKAVKQAIQVLQKAVALDPKQYYAHMLLSQFYSRAPRFFSVGNTRKGLDEAQLAVQYGPQYAITHLSLARNLRQMGQQQEAIGEYKKILLLTPPADAVPETLANQNDAREELRSLGVDLSSLKSEPPATDQASCEAQGKRWEQTPVLGISSCHE
ncbi:MAG: hypothetical protein WC859_06420 [Elusimicrobiota bacterium]|jgi:tetratricopeptide (TPR) repeat protein